MYTKHKRYIEHPPMNAQAGEPANTCGEMKQTTYTLFVDNKDTILIPNS